MSKFRRKKLILSCLRSRDEPNGRFLTRKQIENGFPWKSLGPGALSHELHLEILIDRMVGGELCGWIGFSPIERFVTWKRPTVPTPGSELSQEEWDELPEEITLRYIRLGYENRAGEKQMLVVVTDLLDPEQYDAGEMADLYLRRWEIEVKHP